MLRVSGVLFYAAPVYFVGLMAKLLFGVVLDWLPTSGRAEPATELAIANVSPHTHIYIIDAILYGQPSYIWDVAAAHHSSGPGARSADGGHLPAAGADEPVADHAVRLCRGGQSPRGTGENA